jgi:hypothetical protein
MRGEVQMTIAAASSADLLCRLIGLFAQRDLAAPGMTVDIAGKQMIVTVDLAELDDRTASLLAEKMARCIGVEAVTLDNTPLAYFAPTSLVAAA